MRIKRPGTEHDWHQSLLADLVEHRKLIETFHAQEQTRNRNRLLYPPAELGPVTQFDYRNERRR